LNKEPDHPTCPYCHGAVEEGSILVDVIEMGSPADRNDHRAMFVEKMSEQTVNRIFEIIVMSLDDSPYSEYSEDIVDLIKTAFEPKAKIAYTEIAHLINDNLKRVDSRINPLSS
jgi:hypothetical protein